MVEKNIINEYIAARSCQRPYLLDKQHALLLMKQHSLTVDTDLDDSIDIFSNRNRLILQTKQIQTGKIDRMLTSLDYFYLIASEDIFGAKLMPDRLIADLTAEEGAKYWFGFYKDLRAGNINFSNFKNGEFGSVGFNPRRNRDDLFDQNVCVKFYNQAFPFSQQAWDENLANNFSSGLDRNGKWKLSSVTGVGNYVAFRYLAEAGIPVPKIFLATSEVLIQENIEGYTLSEITDDYEMLKEKKIIDDDLFADMWDWSIDVLPGITKKVRGVIEPIRHNYWSPDFKRYDVNGGNIIFRANNLRDFANNYVLIDPFR